MQSSVRSDRSPVSSGLVALVAAITMLFAAFSSAYIVRRGISSGWTPLRPSAWRWISAITLLLSSAILGWVQRHPPRHRTYRLIVVGLGAMSCVMLIQSWRESLGRGESPAANPAMAFFSIFTAAFLLCFVPGIVAMLRSAMVKASADRRTSIASSALYWHYLAGVWTLLVMLFQAWP